MNRHRSLAIGVVAAAALVLRAGGAAANDRWSGIILFSGYSRYAMDDVNDNLDNPSSTFGPVAVQGDHIEGGGNYGGGLRFWLGTRNFIQFSGEYLPASTHGTGTAFGTTYTGTLDVGGIGLTAGYGRVLVEGSRAGFGVTAGGGWYRSIGDITVQSGSSRSTRDLDGDGPGLHAAAFADYRLSPGVALDAALGYRHARTRKVRYDNSTDVVDSNGEKLNIDWSGPYVRLGIAFYPRRAE